MKRVLVLGSKGFIGSAVAAEGRARGHEVLAVDLENYEASRGSEVDGVIFAGGNARKYLDEREPLEGFRLSVTGTLRALLDFRYKHWIQLSSGAVYPREDDPALNHEEAPLDPAAMSRYGFHKWLAENLGRHYAPRRLVVRMGGFVGPGLRKNAIHDLLAGAPLRVHPDSAFQYMDTRDLARLLFDLLERDLCCPPVLNLAARGTVTLRQAAAWAGTDLPAAANHRPMVRSELNLDQAARLLDLPDSAATVRRFIREVRDGKATMP